MDFRDIPSTPPPRLTISEVEAISGLSRKAITQRKSRGEFPQRIYRTAAGDVYNGEEVYKALGFIKENSIHNDPFCEA